MTTPAGTLTMGNDGASSYRKAPESGIRGLPSSRSNQGLGSPAEANFVACLGASEPSSSRSNATVSPNAMPELWVTKWVDYSSKYGVGYILSDGAIGVYFNDSTKIILSPEGDHFEYITRRTQDKPEARTRHTFEDYPEDLKKKVTLLRHFRNYMLTDVLEKKDGASVGESCLPPPSQKTPATSSQASEPGGAPYVKKWTRNKHAIMFQLSNKIVQVVFFDKTEAVLSSKSHMVTYIDKKKEVCSYPLSNVLDVPSPELAKRLRYTKDILVNLLGARTSELGGA
jgi:polo-like kinase 1